MLFSLSLYKGKGYRQVVTFYKLQASDAVVAIPVGGIAEAQCVGSSGVEHDVLMVVRQRLLLKYAVMMRNALEHNFILVNCGAEFPKCSLDICLRHDVDCSQDDSGEVPR